MTMTPTSGPSSTKFELDVAFTSTNGTGTGEFFLNITTVDGQDVSTTQLLEAQAAGSYALKVSIDTTPADPSCDPTQQVCESWAAGTYPVFVQLCNGECGSKHPHSAILDSHTTSFVITK